MGTFLLQGYAGVTGFFISLALYVKHYVVEIQFVIQFLVAVHVMS